MKKIILTLFVVSVTACQSNNKTAPKKESWAKKNFEKKSQEKDAVFYACIDSVVKEQHLLTEKLKHADTLAVEKIYVAYTDTYYKHLSYIETLQANLIENYYYWVKYDENGVITKMPGFVRQIIKKLDEAGMEIWDEGENIAVLRAKAHYFESVFSPCASDGLKAFLHQDAIDNEVLWLNDASVEITWQQLGEKLAVWENIVKKYPQGVFNKNANSITEYYRQLFLFGTDVSPVMNSSTEQIDSTVKQAFTDFIQKHPNSPTTPLIKEVLNFKGNNTELEKMVAKKWGFRIYLYKATLIFFTIPLRLS